MHQELAIMEFLRLAIPALIAGMVALYAAHVWSQLND